MKCTTCRKEYSPQCDYRQGRCALHPPIIQLKKSKDKALITKECDINLRGCLIQK